MASNFVLVSGKSSTGTRPPHHSAARTDLVLLIRRTVRPRGYASGFESPAALLDGLFEHPVVNSFSAVATRMVERDSRDGRDGRGLIWFIWSIWSVWFNQTNETDQPVLAAHGFWRIRWRP